MKTWLPSLCVGKKKGGKFEERRLQTVAML